jgi:hypothetical protein
LIRLHAVREIDDFDAHPSGKAAGECIGGSAASVVAVEHHDSLRKMRCQKLRLPVGHRGTHQADDIAVPGLVNLHRIEEALHDNDSLLPGLARAMQVEEDLGFSEPDGEAVLGLRSVGRSSGICNEFTRLIVNWYHDATMEEPGTAVEADAEGPGGIRPNGSGAEIGMTTVNTAKDEAERSIRLRRFRRGGAQRPRLAPGRYTKPVPEADGRFTRRAPLHDRH